MYPIFRIPFLMLCIFGISLAAWLPGVTQEKDGPLALPNNAGDTYLSVADTLSMKAVESSPAGAPADHSNASQLLRRLDPACNPSGWKPSLPHGPFLCGWPTLNLYNAAARAVIDAYRLAQAALRVLKKCDEDPSLTRYFDIGTPTVRDRVEKVFMNLLGPSGLGAPEMMLPDFELEIWYRRGSPSKQVYESPVTCDKPGRNGFMVTPTSDLRFAWMVLCPEPFLRFSPTLSAIQCNASGDVANMKMVAPGAIVLHEFMHWYWVTNFYAGIFINDWNAKKDPDVDPPNGYGAYHAQILQEELKDPVLNADNYIWFALEAYWSEQCGVVFGEQYENDPTDDRADAGGDTNEAAMAPPAQASSPQQPAAPDTSVSPLQSPMPPK